MTSNEPLLVTALWHTPRCTRMATVGWDGMMVADGSLDRLVLQHRARVQVRETLQHVPVPSPWDMDPFVDRLEDVHGRPIDLYDFVHRSGPSGGWSKEPDGDIIAYPSNTSRLHQDYIIFHELSHMLCQHQGQCTLSTADAARLGPTLRAEAFIHLLTRVTTEREEYEAELMALLFMVGTNANSPHYHRTSSASAVNRVQRVMDVFA